MNCSGCGPVVDGTSLRPLGGVVLCPACVFDFWSRELEKHPHADIFYRGWSCVFWSNEKGCYEEVLHGR